MIGENSKVAHEHDIYMWREYQICGENTRKIMLRCVGKAENVAYYKGTYINNVTVVFLNIQNIN